MGLNKSKNILIFGPFLILTAGAIFYVSDSHKTHLEEVELLHKHMELLNEEMDSIQKRSELFEELINADKHLLSGDYEAAEKAYEELIKRDQSSSFLSEFIEIRKQKIIALASFEDSTIDDIQTLKFLLNSSKQQNEALNTKILALEQQLNSSLDKYTNDLSDSKQIINELKTKLASKEKVQVISFKNEKGNLIHYLGEVRDGKANGGGVGIFDTGGIYKGEWKNNKRHGKGIYEWKDGHKYEGDFVNGEREGQGTYIWSSGEKYVGQWSSGKRNGEGVLYDKDNNVSFSGLWQDDKIKK